MTSQDEDGLAQQLKDACDESGKEINPAESAEIIYKLGLVYRQRSPDKCSLIRSAGLLNAAIVRNPSNVSQIKENLADLCKHILKEAYAFNQAADLIEKSQHAKECFDELRNEVDQFLLDTMRSDEESLAENPQDEKNTLKFEQEKIANIRFIQTKITDTYKRIMADLFEYCENVMGKPPCEYTVMGMGSLAREEVTPYSDFEYFITVEDQRRFSINYQLCLEYFRWLTVIFHVVILNLQETIIPALCIPSLNNSSSKHGDWFYDTSYTTRGISLDALFPLPCKKFPLGRQELTEVKPWITELIKPVSEMLQYLSSEVDLKNGYHMLNLLTKACFVYGNRKLFDQFVEGVEYHLKLETCDEITSQVREDLNNFSIRQFLVSINKSDTINIKQSIYRSSTLFIEAMARFYHISANSNFDAINEMAEQKKITQQTKNKLLFAVAIACETRLWVYMEHKSQCHFIKIKAHKDGIQNFLNIVGQTSTVHYFQIVYCLQREIAKLLKLTKLHFYTDPRLINVAICRAFQMNWMPKIEILKTSWEIENFRFDDCIALLEEHFNSRQKVDDEKDSLDHSDVDVAKTCFNTAVCLRKLHQLPDSLNYFQKALAIYENNASYMEADGNVARALNNIGLCFCDLHHYTEALDHLQWSLKIFQDISSNEYRDSDVADAMNNIGNCHRNLNQYTEALDYLQRSLRIYEYAGTDRGVAKVYNNIGLCHRDSHQYTKARDYLQKALKLFQDTSSDVETDLDVAEVLNNIGLCVFMTESKDAVVATTN